MCWSINDWHFPEKVEEVSALIRACDSKLWWIAGSAKRWFRGMGEDGRADEVFSAGFRFLRMTGTMVANFRGSKCYLDWSSLVGWRW